MQEILEQIKTLIRPAGTRPVDTGIPGLSMIQGDIPAHQLAALYVPIIGFTVHGTKTLSIGGRETPLRGPSYYVLPLHVPAVATVRPGRDGAPYMSLGLEIQQASLQRLLRDLPADRIPRSSAPFAACAMDAELLEAWYRLLRLMRTPEDIPALAPVYEREILYRVLMGPQGRELWQLGMRESTVSRVGQVVRWFRTHYMHAVDVDELAEKAGMAVNTFHRQFRQATGLSPIQFQKQLRLLEARNLIAFEGYAVARAAYTVGYQSPSQFNREYSRFFGASPARDAEALHRIA